MADWEHEHDIVVVGASIAGCSSAIQFARRGLRVALVERRPDLKAHKVTCTHYIQPSATPAIRRLGLEDSIEAAGGVRNSIDLWTRYGWIRHPGVAVPHGWSIRRERLDPILRDLAATTAGVELMTGSRVTGLVREAGRIVGVRAAATDGTEREVRGRLVVAADGRTSTVAQLAGAPTRTLPNGRFSYWAYFRRLPLATGRRAQLWFSDPQVAYAFPNDDDVTLVAYWGLHHELPGVKADVDGAVRGHFAGLPDAPRLAQGERVSRWLGKTDMPNLRRRPAYEGMALVGDAAQASDPVWGVGCGWAFQSAEWLVDATAPALAAGAPLDRPLAAYVRRHRAELVPHQLMIADYSTGRRFRAAERLLFAAGARDRASATHMHLLAGRLMPVHRFLSPRALGRAAVVVARPRHDSGVRPTGVGVGSA